MNKERKATLTIEGDISPLVQALGQAQDKIKEFEKQAAKSGTTTGGGGGGLPGFLKPFAGALTGGKALEAGVNATTLVFQAFESAAAKATGDLDDMAQAALAVNKAQRDLVSGIPIVGAALSRLMAALGREQEKRMTQAVAGQQALAQELDGIRTSAAGLADELVLLRMALAGASAHTIEVAKAQIDYEKTLQAEQAKELAIQEKLNDAAAREAILAKRQADWEEENRKLANHYRDGGGMHSGNGVLVAGGLTPAQETELKSLRQLIADGENALIESKQKQADLIERQRVRAELRTQKESQKARDRIESVELQNALMRTFFIEDIHERELARLKIEEKSAMESLNKTRAGDRERQAVKETFAIRRELAQHNQQADAEAGRRDLQKRLNAPDNATTAAYVSMSGAVTGAVEEKQLAVLRQTQKDISALVRLEKEKRRREPTIQSREFRRERLN